VSVDVHNIQATERIKSSGSIQSREMQVRRRRVIRRGLGALFGAGDWFVLEYYNFSSKVDSFIGDNFGSFRRFQMNEKNWPSLPPAVSKEWNNFPHI
jgi:hypothetical protein